MDNNKYQYWHDLFSTCKKEGYQAYDLKINNPYNKITQYTQYYSWEYGRECYLDDQRSKLAT